MMVEDQEQRHLCKFCNKIFPCGRSLGGHIRSHMSKNSAKPKGKLNNTKKIASSVNGGVLDFEDGGHVGYGLRENPKKTCRLSDSIYSTLSQGKICKKCGKEYQSWKSLMGHMRYHSERDHMVSDSFDDDSSFSFSEIDQEQEEVAMCLMMLSRDERIWGGFDSVSEFSDTNSVVVEDRSLCLVKKITNKEDSNGAQMVKMKKPRDEKLESIAWDTEKVRFKRKISELEVLRNGFMKFNPNDEDGVEISDAELGKGSYNKNRPKCLEVELGKDLIKEADDQADSEFGKYNSSKRIRSNASDSEIGRVSRKKGKFKCTTCNKVFQSYQALGGHRANCKKVQICFSSNIESSENNIETNVSPSKGKIIKQANKRKKTKYECPICLKVFASGQALGGHKRSHTVENSESREPEIHDLIDLNLPAPIDEDTDGHIGFKPYWVGSNH